MEVGAPFPPQEHLNYIKSKNGEKIILVSDYESQIFLMVMQILILLENHLKCLNG